MRTENQNVVTKWWHTNRDYKTGILLLAQYCKNKILVSSLSKKSEHFGRKKMEYELTKSVGLNHLDMPKKSTVPSFNPPILNQFPVKALQELNYPPSIQEENTEEYPPIIRKIFGEYSALYKQRGETHKEMSAVPEVNTDSNNKTRADLLETIKTHSLRMDFLYKHIELFKQKNLIPLADIIWPVIDPIIIPEDETSLTHRRKNLINANYKDNNKLLFQSIKKLDNQNPMPEGPKKEKLKLKILEREKLITEIDFKLIELRKNAT